LHEKSGTVVRDKKFSDRVGRKILNSLEADESNQDLWYGLFYIKKLEEYKDLEAYLHEADRMLFKGKVGFISRTVE
jgi:hypothetical protein